MISKYIQRLVTIKSLLGRFVFASLVLLPFFIFLSGALLSNAFQHSQLKAETEKLQAQLYLLLSLTEIENKQLILPNSLTEPRFNQQNSGLYGFIYDEKGKEQWRSNSALLISPTLFNSDVEFNIGSQYLQQNLLDNNEAVNSFIYDIEWIDENENSLPLRFVIASDKSALKSELKAYQKRLWQWLSLMGLLLIAAQIIIMRWGLRPLKRLLAQLDELQDNKVAHLSQNYPSEIQPITATFNKILSHEKQQRERYRNTMSDLAHSLKTPLAVIQSQIEKFDTQAPAIRDQVDRINQIISHQLKRAVIQSKQNSIISNRNKILIKTLANRLIKILEKVYTDKKVTFKNLIDDSVLFYGDEADLLELMGNLLDNACKYGDGKVTITGKNSFSQQTKTLLICISDNGPGIAEELQTTLLQRGARGDTAQSGQGIGLSVATDILSHYGGGMTIKNNSSSPHQSGACCCFTLPVQ